jgi:hypothetical protein
MNTSTTKRDGALLTIQIVVWVFMIAAAGFSTMHIVETGHALGLGWEALAAPLFVDGIAIVGKVSMLPRWTKKFRRSGLGLLMVGGVMSLAANIYAGDSLGSRGFGVLVVAGFMLLEGHLTKASKAEAIAPAAKPAVDEELAAKRSEAGRKAAVTRKRNAAEKARQAKANVRRAKANAPISPGVVPFAELDADLAKV